MQEIGIFDGGDQGHAGMDACGLLAASGGPAGSQRRQGDLVDRRQALSRFGASAAGTVAASRIGAVAVERGGSGQDCRSPSLGDDNAKRAADAVGLPKTGCGGKKSEAEDCAAMRVDPAGRDQHGLFGGNADRAQSIHGRACRTRCGKIGEKGCKRFARCGSTMRRPCRDARHCQCG